MHPSPTLAQVLKDRGVRSAVATLGLIIYGLGMYLQMQAGIGLSPWNSLTLGLSRLTGTSFGTASIAISLAIVLLDLLLREPIGIGTILDALVVGWAMDFFLWGNWVATPSFFPWQLALMAAGLVVMCLGAYLYMKTGLSCGPRDALLVALGKRLPRLSIGTINIILLAAVLVVSMLLGVAPGIGTAITIFGTGAVMDLVFKCLRFEPRSVDHEGLAQTWQALRRAREVSSPPAPHS